MVALETIVCGLPVVTGDYSSIPELLDKGKRGFFCPVGDIGVFVFRINIIAQSEKVSHEMNAYNIEKPVRQFALEKILAAYQRLFSKMER